MDKLYSTVNSPEYSRGALLRITEIKPTNRNSVGAVHLGVSGRPAEEVFRKPSSSHRRCPTMKEIKEKVHNMLQHKWYHLTIVALAGLDGLFLIIILFLEIERLQASDAETARKFEDAKFGIECASLVIVIAFLLEIPLNLWMYGIRHYLKSCVETFDALVCLLSFAADVYVIVLTTRERAEENAVLEGKQARTSNSTLCLGGKEKSAPIAQAAGLLVLFRLWRIVRIVNAIIVSVSIAHEDKMSHVKKERDAAQARVEQLEELLASNQLQLPPPIPKDAD